MTRSQFSILTCGIKTILLLVCFSYLVFFCTASFSQTSKIDSLQRSLKSMGEDTNKVNTLNQLCREYNLAGELEKAKQTSNDALLLSRKIDFIPGSVSAILNTGNSFFYEGDYVKALESFKSGLAESEKGNYKKGIANSNNNIGLAYTYQQNYTEALKFHHAALKAYQELQDTNGITKSFNNFGIIYEEQGNYPEALKSYISCLQLAEKLNDIKLTGDAYFNIANVYSGNKNIKQALINYSNALKYYHQIDFKQGAALCYVNMGHKYQEIDSLQSGYEFTHKGYVILDQIGDEASAAQAKTTLGHINVLLGNYSKALEDYSAALKVFTANNDTLHMSNCYRGIGEVYYYQGKPDDALKYFYISLDYAKAVGNKANISGCYGSLANVYEMKNDFKNAYVYHKLYFAVNDSLFNETKAQQIAEMQTRFESEKKDNDIMLLNKDNFIQEAEIKKQKLLKYFVLGGFGLVIIMLLLSYRTYRIRQSLRLQDIRNKIAGDLHDDIGSTLNSISIYSEVARRKDEQQDEALEMIGEASRKIIESMSDIVWTVNPENDSFEKIIFRMKSLAYNLFRAKKIEFTFHSDEALNDKKLTLEARRNFYLLFKEAVNNMIKYSNATRASITLASIDDTIRLVINDNGIGFNPSDEVIGNGLKNMKRRAEEINAQFRIESSPGNGTHVELSMKA